MVAADGGLVTEPFVDAHLHLDKVRTLPLIGDEALRAYTADGMSGSARSIDLASTVKRHYTVERLAPGDPAGARRRRRATASCTCRRSPTSTRRPAWSGSRR